MAKALDKLETILQHNQGTKPDNFDYAFNLSYGKRYTADIDLTRKIRVRHYRRPGRHFNFVGGLCVHRVRGVGTAETVGQ